jgi:hypothetical protein
VHHHDRIRRAEPGLLASLTGNDVSQVAALLHEDFFVTYRISDPDRVTRPASVWDLTGRSLPSVNSICPGWVLGSRGGVSRALRGSPIRGVVGHQSCLLEYGPRLVGMAAAGDDVIAGRDEGLR